MRWALEIFQLEIVKLCRFLSDIEPVIWGFSHDNKLFATSEFSDEIFYNEITLFSFYLIFVTKFDL